MPDDQLVAIYERVHSAYLIYSGCSRSGARILATTSCSAMLAITDEDGKPALTNDQVLGAHGRHHRRRHRHDREPDHEHGAATSPSSPDQLQLVLDDPSLWENAMREGLRRAAISNQLFRISLATSEIAGVTIPAGSNVAREPPRGERRPAKFPRPAALRRAPRERRRPPGARPGPPLLPRRAAGAAGDADRARDALPTAPDLKADLDQELEFVPSLAARVISQRVSWGA